MLRFIIYALLFYIVAILQTVVVPRFEIMEAKPNLLLILTVIVALRQGSLAGCLIGFMCGLLSDVYAPIEWLGAFSLAYCIVGFVAGQIEESFINLNLIPKIVVLVMADFLKDSIYYLSTGKTLHEMPAILSSLTFPSAIYTVCVSVAFFYLLSLKTERKVEIYNQGL